MALGYHGKLYILAFDHRGSFQKKMFGSDGDPTPEETETIADAKGDIQRGVEVVEFALGVPHLMKGEYTDGAGPGIDLY